MTKLNPIDPTEPRLERGAMSPDRPGMVFQEYRSRVWADGVKRWSEKWLRVEANAKAHVAHAADREKHKHTHLGHMRVLRDKRRHIAIMRGCTFLLSVRDLVEMYPADGCCPVFGLKFVRDGGRASATINRVANEIRVYDRRNCEIVSRSYNSCVQAKTIGARVAHAKKAPRHAVTLADRAIAGVHLDATRAERGFN